MKTLEQRFLDKVLIPEDKTACWQWQAGKARNYGHIYVLGKALKAHRLSYQLFKGELIAGKVIMHTCDNSLCVNPNHLEQGTQADNLMDCRTKGRRPTNYKKP